VGGARVEVIGRNGEPVAAATTDADRPRAASQASRSQARENSAADPRPEGSDFSFMPLRASGRNLDLSRFETGGVENATSAQQLSAYLFTRSRHLPARRNHASGHDHAHGRLEVFARRPSVDVEISDPRGNVVRRDKIKLSGNRLRRNHVHHSTHLAHRNLSGRRVAPKDEKRREMLGSVSFNVQEFEPDRMKVRLDLSDKTFPGWLTPADVKARVNVMQLCLASPPAIAGSKANSIFPPCCRASNRTPTIASRSAKWSKSRIMKRWPPPITDDKGNAELNLDLKRFAGRAYRLNVLARAFEAEGGRSVAAQNTAIVSDAPYLVGVKPDGDLSFVQPLHGAPGALAGREPATRAGRRRSSRSNGCSASISPFSRSSRTHL
jgi:alpha-2-macroglobulin